MPLGRPPCSQGASAPRWLRFVTCEKPLSFVFLPSLGKFQTSSRRCDGEKEYTTCSRFCQAFSFFFFRFFFRAAGRRRGT